VAVGFKESVAINGFLNPAAFFGFILGGILNLVVTTLETFAFKYINAVAGSQLLFLENVFEPIFGFAFIMNIFCQRNSLALYWSLPVYGYISNMERAKNTGRFLKSVV